MENSLQLPSGYQELLQELKGRIRNAQVRAAFAVNRELVLLYWSIGRDLARQGWKVGAPRLSIGSPMICRLEFPGVEGFSPRNLRYMRSLAEAWPEQADFAAACCKIALGPPSGASGPDQGPPHARVVPSRRARIRLESGCPGPADQERSA